MSASLVAFRSADPLVAAQSRARVAQLEVERRAAAEIRARREQLLALADQVADELSRLTPDQLRARLAELELLDLRLAALTADPAARGARSAANALGEGAATLRRPLPLRSDHNPQP